MCSYSLNTKVVYTSHVFLYDDKQNFYQVGEVGIDRWIAAKEPSEFMDECTISVYKEGHCPEDVLEDINKGELPDEIKGQARHLVESQSKAIQRKGKKEDEEMIKNSIEIGLRRD